MKYKNSLTLGTLLGLITAFISTFLVYLIMFSNYAFHDYLNILMQNKKLLAPVISIAGIPNLGLFYLFINKNLYQSARGVILATFILVVIVIVIKIAL